MRTWLILLLAAEASASPIHLGHQGRLLDAAGGPINGAHDLVVSLRDGQDAQVYAASFGGYVVEDGFYSVILGEALDLEDSVLDAPELYVAVSIDGVVMPGRQLLVETPRAARANRATVATTSERIRVDGAAADGECTEHGALIYDTALSGLRICVDGDWKPIGVRTIVSTGNGRKYSDGTTARSCLAYLQPTGGYIYAGDIGDGTYIIDVDGTGPLPEASVTCDMSNDGWTLFHHDREVRFQSPSGESPLSIVLPVTYTTTVAVLVAAEAAATQVAQYISKECRDSLIDNGTQYTGWRYPPNTLAPSSAWPNRAQCDMNDATLRESAGDVTNGAYLPIVEIDNGDATGPGEIAYFTLGPFRVR